MKIWARMGKYISANMGEEERREFEFWLSKHPEYQVQLAEIGKIWALTGDADSQLEPNLQHAWERFESRRNKISPSSSKKELKNWGNWKGYVAIAASLGLILSLGFWYFSQPISKREALTYSTTEHIKRLTLPDSSELWLNAFSEISYRLENGERKLSLSGEAFFNVKRDESQPFVIYSGAIATRVLGTSFNLRAYPEDDRILVEVESGKVIFGESTKKPIILTKGKGGSFDKSSSAIETYKLNSNNRNAWRVQKLSFQNEKMDRVISDMEQYFRIEFEVENPHIMDCHFTSTFENPELEDLLEVMKYALDLEVEKSGRAYLIKGKGCKE